jgi:hypothetical protein
MLLTPTAKTTNKTQSQPQHPHLLQLHQSHLRQVLPLPQRQDLPQLQAQQHLLSPRRPLLLCLAQPL